VARRRPGTGRLRFTRSGDESSGQRFEDRLGRRNQCVAFFGGQYARGNECLHLVDERVELIRRSGRIALLYTQFYRVIKSPASENGRCILVSVPEGQAGSRAEVVAA